MDLQSALVWLLVFVLSAAILIFISMFGIRQKSYEEALAEQRQLTGGLLGTNQRTKLKEKKQKKVGKKVKEKSSAPKAAKQEKTEESDGAATDVLKPVVVSIAPAVKVPTSIESSPSKTRVEFEEKAVMVELTEEVISNKKRTKKEKMKPILLNKESSPVIEADLSKSAFTNHFEQTHPKDDFELLQKHKSESPKQEKQDLETKQKNADTKKQGAESKKQNIEAKKQDIEFKKQSNENKKALAENKKQDIESKKPVDNKKSENDGKKQQTVETKKQNAESKKFEPETKKQNQDNKKQPVENKKQNAEIKKQTSEAKKQEVENKKQPIEVKKHVSESKKPEEQKKQSVELKKQDGENKKQSVEIKKQEVEIKKSESEIKNTKAPKVKQENNEPTKAKPKEKKQAQVIEELLAETEVVTKSVAPIQNNAVINSVKEKKKKKSEFNTLQQLSAGEKHGVSVSLLVPLVRKADLSRSEIQILIDLLLNKQHEAPAVYNEWSEGKSDPVQKLKKQLAEKERTLTEQQEALGTLHTKLHEIRAEVNAEKSRLSQNCRNLEETIHAKSAELHTSLGRIHTLNQKNQQLQTQVNEEVMTARKLREELKTMQLQRQQMEMVLNEKQQAEGSFQSQLAQLRNDHQEQVNINAQLSMELRTLHEKNHAEKEMLHERVRQIESQAVHYKNELDHYKNELEQKQDLHRQLEESRRIYSELEHRFGVTHHNEKELQVRCQQHLEDIRRVEVSQNKSHEELAKLQSDISRLNMLLKQQQDDSNRIVGDLQKQLQIVQDEKNQLKAANEAADQDKSKEVEILNLQNELTTLRARLQENDTYLTTELKSTKASVQELEIELKAQRNKNDELRKKNWKVMEALNTAENSLRNKQKDSVNVGESSKKIKSEEDKYKQFLKRLFPEVDVANDDKWMQNTEKSIKNYVTTLQNTATSTDNSEEVAELQAQLAHCRTIIEDTDGMLNKLQAHVKEEEMNWRKRLEAKQVELETVKEQTTLQSVNNNIAELHGVQFAFTCMEKSLPTIIRQLQAQISDLENKLAAEGQSRLELRSECEALKSKAPSLTHTKHTQFSNFAEVEQMREEKVRLTEELLREQQRCRELNDEVLRYRESESNSVNLKSVQNHTANGTSVEQAELPNSASSSSISPTSTKPRNKNRKKK